MNEEEKVEVNVEQNMQEIRTKVQMDEELQGLPKFEDIPIRAEGTKMGTAAQDVSLDLKRSMQYINASYDIPYYWSFGPAGIKTFLKRVVRKLLKCLIPPILEKQNRFNAHVVRCLNALSGLFAHANVQAEEIASLKRELSSYREETEKQAKELSAYREENEKQTKVLQEMMQLIGQKASVQQLNSAEDQLRDLRQKIDNLDRQADASSAATAKLLMKYRSNEDITVIQEDKDERHEQKKPNTGESVYTILDYFKFQNYFRGTRSVISEKQKMYLPYFQNSAGPVIDVGCGRGEFLRLMKDNHITAFGVDLYPEYEVEGEINGLDVRQGNGIEFLKNSDLKFGGIFSAQVIEHISFSELQELCAAAYEKLLPGAYLVLETPNPTCLAVYTATFYVDPTHNKPVHPLLLEYILKEVGFSDIQIVFTEASRLDVPLPLIESDAIHNLQEINNAITRVSNLLYGSVDYAVIARK